MAYNFGCRRGEILKMRVYQVSLEDWTITLDETKNGEIRIAPMTQEVHDLLATCIAGKGSE